MEIFSIVKYFFKNKVQAAANFRSSICVQMNFNVDIRDPRPKYYAYI